MPFYSSAVIYKMILTLYLIIEASFSKPNPGGGAHKHFFDRDASPRTNFNYPKSRMTLNSNPKKIECPEIQTQKIE